MNNSEYEQQRVWTTVAEDQFLGKDAVIIIITIIIVIVVVVVVVVIIIMIIIITITE